jgi:hypothetical protein
MHSRAPICPSQDFLQEAGKPNMQTDFWQLISLYPSKPAQHIMIANPFLNFFASLTPGLHSLMPGPVLQLHCLCQGTSAVFHEFGGLVMFG